MNPDPERYPALTHKASKIRFEFWCPYDQRMTIILAEEIPVRTAVGSAVKVVDCLKPCQNRGTNNCLIGRRLEGVFP